MSWKGSGRRGRHRAAPPEKTLNPPGTATPMHPRPFLLLIAGFALALMAVGEADAAGPVATIDSIDPSATEAGTTVLFNGSGSDSDGSVVA